MESLQNTFLGVNSFIDLFLWAARVGGEVESQRN